MLNIGSLFKTVNRTGFGGNKRILDAICDYERYELPARREYLSNDVCFPMFHGEFLYDSVMVGEIEKRFLVLPDVEDCFYEAGKRIGNSKEILYSHVSELFSLFNESMGRNNSVSDDVSDKKEGDFFTVDDIDYYYRYLCSPHSRNSSVLTYLFGVVFYNGQRNIGVLDKVLESSPMVEIVRGMIFEILSNDGNKFRHMSEEAIIRYINSKLPVLFQINMGVYREFVRQRNLGYNKFPHVLSIYYELSTAINIFKSETFAEVASLVENMAVLQKDTGVLYKLYGEHKSSLDTGFYIPPKFDTPVEDAHNSELKSKVGLTEQTDDEVAKDIISMVNEQGANDIGKIKNRIGVGTYELLDGVEGEEEDFTNG